MTTFMPNATEPGSRGGFSALYLYNQLVWTSGRPVATEQRSVDFKAACVPWWSGSERMLLSALEDVYFGGLEFELDTRMNLMSSGYTVLRLTSVVIVYLEGSDISARLLTSPVHP